MSEAVVANAGPLIVLAKLSLLYLLKQLYGQIQFPRSVYQEVVIEGVQRGFEDAHTLQLFLSHEGWKATEVGEIPDDLASWHLDRGEQESIALALALKGLLLIDEERGREAARRMGVKVRGTLGVLIQAYRSGLSLPTSCASTLVRWRSGWTSGSTLLCATVCYRRCWVRQSNRSRHRRLVTFS